MLRCGRHNSHRLLRGRAVRFILAQCIIDPLVLVQDMVDIDRLEGLLGRRTQSVVEIALIDRLILGSFANALPSLHHLGRVPIWVIDWRRASDRWELLRIELYIIHL